MNQWPRQSEVNEFYGDPVGEDGHASPEWEVANLVLIRAPWMMTTAWTPHLPIRRGIRVHFRCAKSMERLLFAIWEASGRDMGLVKKWGVDLLGGGYCFRATRGGSRLSMHAYGCALDIDPERNGFGNHSPNFRNCQPVLDAFAAEGWEWGGEWSVPDGMHWQAARTR